MTAVQTRFASIGRAPAIAILLALLLLIGLGLSLGGDRVAQTPAVSGRGDANLYRAIDTRMLACQGYYQAATAEHRARGYPLRPFVTVRMPTLAWSTTLVGGPAHMVWLEALLTILSMCATIMRLKAMMRSPWMWGSASLLAVPTAVLLFQSAPVVWHELWAGLLTAMALMCWSERRWLPSVALGLAAVLFRELAMPFLFAMAACALLERRPREAWGWAGAILIAALALAAHAMTVHALLRPGDLTSPGWSRFGGWRFDMALVRESSLLALLPASATAVLLPITLLGWAGWSNRYAARFALSLAGWLGAFLLIGRPDNFYWGLLIGPLMPIGLVVAFPALRDLLRAAWQSAPERRFAAQ